MAGTPAAPEGNAEGASLQGADGHPPAYELDDQGALKAPSQDAMPVGGSNPRQACEVDTRRYGPHVGAATHGGVVCSRHAMWFKSDGTPRGGVPHPARPDDSETDSGPVPEEGGQ